MLFATRLMALRNFAQSSTTLKHQEKLQHVLGGDSPNEAKHLERYIQGALKAFAGSEYESDPEKLSIGPQDIFLFFDAMKHQQDKVWKDCFINNAQKWKSR